MPDTFGICAGDYGYLEIQKKLDKNARVIWENPYTGKIEFANVENAKRLQVIDKGWYKVKVTMNKVTYYDSTYVYKSAKPRLSLRDTTLCKGKLFYLDAKNQGMKYLWSTGETTQKIRVENSGMYWVKVNNNGCIQSDTLNVKFLPGSTTNFDEEISFCLSEPNKVLSIKTQPNTKIQWSTGSIYPSINVATAGKYWVKTENKNCGEQVDTVRVKLKACDCEMMIPNSFTPNEDNRNDYFFPVVQCEYSSFSMTIMDKWENIVFYTNSVNGKWDGRFKGNLCPEGVYFYVIESVEKGSDKKQPRKGTVSLFR